MNGAEFLAELAAQLRNLPPEERGRALRYYEEYLAAAGPAHERDALRDLGSPAQTAERILRHYRRAVVPPRPARKGIAPGALVLLLILALLFWPVALGGVCAALGLVLAAALLAPVLLLLGLAFLGGGGMMLLHAPAGSLVLFGTGCVLLALGMFAAAVMLMVCMRFGPPALRGLVRWIGGLFGRERQP